MVAGIEFPCFKKAFPGSPNTKQFDDRVGRARVTAGSDSWEATKMVVESKSVSEVKGVAKVFASATHFCAAEINV